MTTWNAALGISKACTEEELRQLLDPCYNITSNAASLARSWSVLANKADAGRCVNDKNDVEDLRRAIESTALVLLEALFEFKNTPFDVFLQKDVYDALASEADSLIVVLKFLASSGKLRSSACRRCQAFYPMKDQLQEPSPEEARSAAETFYVWLTAQDTPMQTFLTRMDGEGSFYSADEEPSAQTLLEAAEHIDQFKDLLKPEVYTIIEPEIRCLIPHCRVIVADYEPGAKKQKLQSSAFAGFKPPTAENVDAAEKTLQDWLLIRISPLKGFLKAFAGRGKFFDGSTAIKIASACSARASKGVTDFQAAVME